MPPEGKNRQTWFLKEEEEDILHWQACSAWNDAFRLWPSPPLPLLASSQAWNPEPCQTLVLQTHLYTGWHRFILLVGTLQRTISTQGGTNLDDMAVDNVSYSFYDDILPPFSACPCPASIKRVRQAAGWAEGEIRSGTISNGIVTAIAIVRSGGAGTVTMDGGTLIHQPIVMTHRRCGLKKPNTSHSILGWHQPKLDQNPELIFNNLWLDLTIMETQKSMFRDNQTISDDGLFVLPSNILFLSLFLLA